MSKVIIISGPTAIGKSSIALELAQNLDAPILSADSRQVYKEMTIGTAQPNEEELKIVKHYFINSHSIQKPLSAGTYQKEARVLVDQLAKDHKYIIIVGGTGFYIKALLEGIDEPAPKNQSLRNDLEQSLKESGVTSLSKLLKELDISKYQTIDKLNSRRLIRAIEIAKYRQKNPLEEKNPYDWPYETTKICLTGERTWLYDRINNRVDQMIKEGLVQEVKSLHSMAHLQALDTVGYRELFSYLDGDISLEEGIELIKRNSRRYAKRQITWFKNQSLWNYIDVQKDENAIKLIKELIS